MHKRLLSSYFLAILISVAMLGTTFLFWKTKQNEITNSQKNVFSKSTNRITDKINSRLIGYEFILSGVKGFYENSSEVTRNEFVNYVKTINFEQNGHGLLAISLIQFVPDSQRNDFISWMHEQGYKNFNIVPEGVRSNYAPITYIYPELESNLKVLGFDLLTKDSVSPLLIRSRDSGDMTMTGRIKLVQDFQSEGNSAQVIYVPIYNKQKPISTLLERKIALTGWVSAPFRFRDLMSSLPNPVDEGINLDIYEGKVVNSNKHLYGSGLSHKIKQGDVKFFITHTIDVGGQQWTLGFSTLPKFDENFNVSTHHWLAVVGTAFSLLSGLLVWLMGVGRNNALTLAEQMTQDLRLHAKVFESSQEGFFITDAANRIISVNHGFSKITGYTSKEALGSNPSMLSSGKQDASFYKEMWDCLNRHKYWQGELFNRRKNGAIYPEWLSISAVVDNNNQVTNYVCVFSDLSERKNAEEAIHNLAFYDNLTGLPNRQLLLERINDCIESSGRNKSHYALLYIDVDDFKRLNETMGYGYGDLLLMEIAHRLQVFTSKFNTLARLGSDEFVILVSDLNERNQLAVSVVNELVGKIFTAIKEPYVLNSYHYSLKVSIGISLFSGGIDSPANILKLAEIAMSQAKNTGRDKIHFFDETMKLDFEKRVLLESALRQAIPDELVLNFQPQVDSNGSISGAEALIRWQSKENGLVSPANFIPIAEDSGLIFPIGQWVIDSACKQLKAWESNQRTQNLILAINISPKQFGQADFVKQIINAIEHFEVNPNRVKLEITESLLLDDRNAAIEKMKLLKEKGVRLSLDDFGTGYSSLSYLKHLPLNQLKIDQSFVRRVDTDPVDKAIARAIVILGDTLGLNVIAEGVETNSQREALIECGCHYFQGYYFSKPLRIDDFQKLMDSVSD